MMRSARFDPALDKAGTPVKMFYVNRLKWFLR